MAQLTISAKQPTKIQQMKMIMIINHLKAPACRLTLTTDTAGLAGVSQGEGRVVIRLQ